MANGLDTTLYDPVKQAARRRKAQRQKKLGPRATARADKVIALIAQGDTIEEATAKIGVSDSAYKQWRKVNVMNDSRKFKDEIAKVRARLAGEYKIERRPFDAAFRREYFSFPTMPYQQQMIDFINDVGPAELGLIQLPPDHAKSTFMEDFCCHNIAMDPDIRILYVSRTEGRAKKAVQRVQRRLTDPQLYANDNPLLRDYGPFKGEGRGLPWTNKMFYVLGQTSGERDPTMEAVGINGQIYGARIDIMILDDIADTENQTEAMIEQQKIWLEQIVLTRMGTEGRVLCVGTRIKPKDIYSEMEEQGFFDHILRLPAILREPGTNGSEDPGESLWPERFPPEFLIEKRRNKMAEDRWELVYQQNDQTKVGRTFPIEVIRSCHAPLLTAQRVPEGSVPVGGLDPSASGFTAGVCFGVNPKTKLRTLVDVWNEPGLTGDGGDIQEGLIQFILGFCETYHLRWLCLEDNSAFVLLSTSVKLRTGLTDLGVNLMTVKSTGTGLRYGGQEMEDMSIKSLSTLFFNKTLQIPAQGHSLSVFRDFERQFSKWVPGEKKLIKDIVKATQFAEAAARRIISNESKPTVTGQKLTPAQKRKQRTVKREDSYATA